MQLTELRADDRFIFEHVPCEKIEDGAILSSAGRVESYGLEEFFFRSRDANFPFKIIDAAQRSAVKDSIAKKFVALAAVTTLPAADEKFFCLRIIFFMRAVNFGRFQIILSNTVRESLREKNFPVADYESLAKIFRLSDGVSEGGCFAFVSTVPPADNAETSEPSKKVFRIEGRECRLFVRVDGDGFDSRAIAYRAEFNLHDNLNDALGLQLAYGDLEFSDEQSFVSERVREILQASPNYISIWNEYANREGDFLLQHARAVGEISYLPKFNQTNEGLALTLRADGKFDLSYLSVGDYVEVREEPPPYIADSEMTWQDYQLRKAQNSLSKKIRPPQFEIAKIDNGMLILKVEQDFPTDGKLYLSIRGDEKQIETRVEARRRIENGESALPNLGLILGSTPDKIISFPAKNLRHIAPRSDLLNQKIFRNEPTPRQIQAIDVALNTPDIAIIQGPPGTGKTTVITAIIERLNEISDKTKSQAGQVLITSLQHDAVENVIERVKINSLPTIKFGRRNRDENRSPEEQLNQWCADVLSALEKKHPALRRTDEERQLFDLFDHYTQSPSNAKALNFLKAARNFVREKSLLEDIDEIIARLEPLKTSGADDLPKKIYRLPTCVESFGDGGQEILIDLFNELEELFGERPSAAQEKILSTLREGALTDSPDEKFFGKLAELKSELLSRCIRPPMFDSQEARDDVTEIYEQVRQSLARPQDAATNIVFELYRELRDNPQAIRQAVGAYSFAFAATAQQSDRKEIKLAKNVERPWDEKSHATYETVIVDEAARITPGDLMIPLSQASRRIILVGDQRQLPHIYDEEIFQALREDGQLEHEDDIKVSMFGHLWEKAHELEKADGIPRAITLDAQYRMHPTLGNFVSENFYPPEEAFRSPRPATDFAQEICPSPVRWVNIPAARGKDFRSSNRSLRRNCEVDYIAATLDAYLADPKNAKLSFGVISFYRAQAQEIYRRLKNYGTRVRVGTVDEFQGMEFDVIFLSVVRSGKDFSDVDINFLENPPPESDKDAFAEYEKIRDQIGGKIYGFLTVKNRLCVALSRQKRLLIVVGDAEMFCGETSARVAKICVPAMFNLYKLCETEGSVVDG